MGFSMGKMPCKGRLVCDILSVSLAGWVDGGKSEFLV